MNLDVDALELLEGAYRSIIMSYVWFYIAFIIFEAYIRTTRTCYKPFAWNVIMNFTNICYLSFFLFQCYLSFFTESLIIFLYIVLIAYFVRNLINGVLDRVLSKN